MTPERAKELAAECGFNGIADLDTKTLEFLPEVRDMCAADRCHSYGKTWSCPPACGSIEDWKEKASHYSKGLLLQYIGEREDSFDFEAAMEAGEKCKECLDKLTALMRADGMDFLAMGAGTCTKCKKCTYPDAPCRFPETLFPSMEACGLFISKVCTDNNLPYNYGDTRIAFTCCVLF